MLSQIYSLLLILIKVVFWYLICSLGRILFEIIKNLRTQVFNKDLKFSRKDLENRFVLITGATSGIGLANSLYFHARGFKVIACYYSADEPGFKRLESLNDVDSIYLVKLDVRSESSIALCYQRVNEIFTEIQNAKLHALINVAGVAFMAKSQFMPRKFARATIETNLLGPILMVQQFLPLLIKCPGSRIINTSSGLAFLPTRYNAAYCATKLGLTNYTNCLRLDLAKYDVQTITIHPGNLILNTPILNNSFEDGLTKILSELTDEEREIYNDELEEHKILLKQISSLRERPINLELSLKNKLSKNVRRVAAIFSGCVSGKELHLTGVMRSYDNAIYMRQPPWEMFAANPIYDIVSGSFLHIVGHSTRTWMLEFLARRNFHLLY